MRGETSRTACELGSSDPRQWVPDIQGQISACAQRLGAPETLRAGGSTRSGRPRFQQRAPERRLSPAWSAQVSSPGWEGAPEGRGHAKARPGRT